MIEKPKKTSKNSSQKKKRTSSETIHALTEYQRLIDMRLKLQLAVAKLSQKALSKTPLSELCKEAANQLYEILAVDYVKVLKLNPDKKELTLKHGIGWKKSVKPGKTTLPANKGSHGGYTISVKKPVIIRNLKTDKRFNQPNLLLDHGVVSGMSVLLYKNTGIYGVLGVHSKSERKFTQDDISYLESVATTLSFAIQQHESQQKLKQNVQTFRHLSESIPQIVWIADDEGNVEYFNQRWQEYTGLEASHSYGDSWNKSLHPDDRNRAWRIWNNSIKTGQLYETQYRIKEGSTGRYRWFLARAIPIRDEAGTILKWFGTCTDVHDQKQALQGLEESKALTEAILQSLPSQIAVLDQKGNIVAVNETLKKFTFDHTRIYPSELSTGNNYLKILHQSRSKLGPVYSQIRKGITAVLQAKEQSFSLEYPFRTKDKQELWFLLQVAPLKHQEVGVVVSHTDITDRKLLEKQKDEFMSIASHELKTPLTSIKAYAQVLQRMFLRDGDSNSADLIGKLDAQLDKLTELISDFLDVSKIEAGRLQFEEEWFDLSELIRDTVEALSLTTNEQKIVIKDKTSLEILANRDRIGQVLTNFISNAIKYSPTRTVITVGTKKSKDEVIVSVEDQGVGIPKNKLKKVFDRFYRVSHTNKESMPGLGLGLYISAEIIKFFQGRIWVESGEQTGSIFYFSLPKDRVRKKQ